MPDGDGEVTEDGLLGGAIRLRQPRRGHRAGTDAVLLAALARIGPSDRVLDLGSASGAVGLMIAARVPTARLTFVDDDPALIDLCRENIADNGLGNRARAVLADVFDPGAWEEAGLGTADHDAVVTNPPFLEGSPASPHAGRRAAHSMVGGNLAAWVRAAGKLLSRAGRLTFIHRADRLADCLGALSPAFGAVDVRPIQPRADEPAHRIVVAAVLGSRAPLRISAALVLHEPGGCLTEEAARLHARP